MIVAMNHVDQLDAACFAPSASTFFIASIQAFRFAASGVAASTAIRPHHRQVGRRAALQFDRLCLGQLAAAQHQGSAQFQNVFRRHLDLS